MAVKSRWHFSLLFILYFALFLSSAFAATPRLAVGKSIKITPANKVDFIQFTPTRYACYFDPASTSHLMGKLSVDLLAKARSFLIISVAAEQKVIAHKILSESRAILILRRSISKNQSAARLRLLNANLSAHVRKLSALQALQAQLPLDQRACSEFSAGRATPTASPTATATPGSTSGPIDSNPNSTPTPTTNNQITLNLQASGGGVTVPTAGIRQYALGTSVSVRARPDSGNGFTFTGWTGSVDADHASENPVSLLLNSNKTVTAQFTKDTSLLAHWRFAEQQGFLAADASGHNRDGSLTGEAGWTNGVAGPAVNFPATGSRIIVPTDLISTHAATVCAWFNSASGSYGSSVISNGSFTVFVSTSIDGTAPSKRLSVTNDGQHAVTSTAEVVMPNTWVHLCVTRAVDGTANIYINGSLSGGGNAGSPVNGLGAVTIGNTPYTNGHWDGSLADVRIYDRVLSDGRTNENDNEISQLYSSVGGLPALTVVKSGAGSGVVTSATTGINCGTSCSKSYQPGTTITLSASADAGSDFLGWSGGSCHGRGTCITTVDENTSITATFGIGLPETLPVPNGNCTPNISGTTITACSCASTDVQNAINQVPADGFTVLVPAGTCTWSHTVTEGVLTTAKSMVIKGAGQGQTVIYANVDAPNMWGPAFSIATALGNSFRLTGFSFLSSPTLTNVDVSLVQIGGFSQAFRIDHNYFDSSSKFYRSIYLSDFLLGVVDHNTIFFQNQAIDITHQAWGGANYGDGSWAEPLSFGSNRAVFIEDNSFTGTGADVALGEISQGATDAYGGARFVVRNNTITNGAIFNHGTDSSGRIRGSFSYEVYNNTFIFPPGNWAFTATELRGGTSVFHHNKFIGLLNTLSVIENYRLFSATGIWGACDGTGPYDDNDPTVYAAGLYSGPTRITNALNEMPASNNRSWAYKIIDPSKNWTTNQWVGYSLHNYGREDAPFTAEDFYFATTAPIVNPLITALQNPVTQKVNALILSQSGVSASALTVGNLTATTFKNAFPSQNAAYGEQIFSWLRENNFVDSYGAVIVDLTSSPVLTALQAQFTDAGEFDTILNVLGNAPRLTPDIFDSLVAGFNKVVALPNFYQQVDATEFGFNYGYVLTAAHMQLYNEAKAGTIASVDIPKLNKALLISIYYGSMTSPPWGSLILANDANSITVLAGANPFPRSLIPGDAYQILKVNSCIDQGARSAGSHTGALSGDNPAPYGWVNETKGRSDSDPTAGGFYLWNNLQDTNPHHAICTLGGSFVNPSAPSCVEGPGTTYLDTGSTGVVPVSSGNGFTALENVDYFIGVARPNYSPYEYPHPLTVSGFTAN